LAKQLIIALFADAAAADAAVDALQAWDKADSHVKLDHLAILTADKNGKLKSSQRGRVAGAALGAGIGVGTVILAGAIIGGPLFLPVAGGVIGALASSGLGLKAEDRSRIAAELTGGKAAVGVLASDLQAPEVSAKLAELGGAPESHDVPADVEADIAEADAAAG
jgi:uncharacterized membrane protein